VHALSELSETEGSRLRGLLFDLDDTLLDAGKLSEAAYASLFRLKEAGFELFAVTGRPAGWGQVLARQWPIDGVVSENGAVACYGEGHAVRTIDNVEKAERLMRRARLAAIVSEIRTRFTDLHPADDVDARMSDYTFDIGEQFQVPVARVQQVVRFAEEYGARTLTSSVHLHVSFDRDDKASGSVRFIRHLRGLDPTLILSRYAFIGDSQNDEACFSAFRTTIGVSNLSGRPTLKPRFITSAAKGAGFVEAAARLIELKLRAKV
jgi:HAD superfamily hydrolase (TIGR01484 family)